MSIPNAPSAFHRRWDDMIVIVTGASLPYPSEQPLARCSISIPERELARYLLTDPPTLLSYSFATLHSRLQDHGEPMTARGNYFLISEQSSRICCHIWLLTIK
jgi:hypothetical protein